MKTSPRIDDLRRRLAQIDELLAQSLISADAGRAARQKLQSAIVDAVMAGDVPAAPGPRVASARMSRSLLGAGLVVVAAFVVVAYELQREGAGAGAPMPAGAAAMAEGSAPPASDNAAVETTVAALVEGLRTRPDDADGWATLGRAYSALGRHGEALAAYKRALELRPRDAQALADVADGLAVLNSRSLDGEPEKLVLQALQFDPANVKALSLAGTAAFNRADFAGAITFWQRAVDASEPGAEMTLQLQGALADARQRAGQR